MARITLLSEDLINKIAAGEVVERPASVVKELVENSVDAGARNVRMSLKDGGLSLIRVIDDGHGMSRDDALMALQRHATSKLRDLEGLSRILTMGFRGEAIPAIASVCRFKLATSEPGASVGTQIAVEGGAEPVVEDAAPVGGTVITAEELFFNTPARRKFMKRALTEQQHAEEALLRIALAHPEVGFTVETDGDVAFASKGSADVRERIAAALGAEVHPHLAEVDERRLDARIKGFVASPEFTMPTQRGLYTFINGRYVRDRGLNHSIQRAYQDALPPGRQPVAVLYIEMDPRDVDVNVHPQKLEVRFQDGRGLYDGVFAAVQRALRSSPWMKTQAPLPAADSLQGAHYAAAVERFLARAQPRVDDAPTFPPSEQQPSPGFGQLRPTLNDAPPPGFFAAMRCIGALGRRLLVCEGAGSSLLVLDPHAAAERIALSAFTRRLRKKEPTQPTLFAATVELAPSTAKAIAAHGASLRAFGVEVEPFGGVAFALKGLPPELSSCNPTALLEELAPVLPDLDAAARVLACHAAPKEAPSDGQRLLQELDAADFTPKARHGTVVVEELSFMELLRRAEQKN